MSCPEKPWYLPMIVAFLSDDVPRLLGIPQQMVARDIHTLERRLACEGEGFLTKTLPSFGKAIDLALQGHVPLATTLFKKKGRSALPAFLSALLRRVFSDAGWVLDNPCHQTIKLIRQLCFWCKKLERGYTDEALQKAFADFIEIDEALPDTLAHREDQSALLDCARVLLNRIFARSKCPQEFSPRHGPGAVAGNEGLVGKRNLAVSYAQLERVFRPVPWFRSLRDAAEDYSCVTDRVRKPYGLDRIAAVEKDSSGPRLIGLPPAEYMWCQQALKEWLYDYLQHSRHIARGHVNFDDQTINRRKTSEWRDYDTLDMSKASDRNSLALVKDLWSETWLWPYLQASRTRGAVLPNGAVIQYKKFAPMGSAVCFPVQAVTYYVLACAALHLLGKIPLWIACRKVYVYGDDLIVPHGFFSVLNEAFESVGLVFNQDKCCTHGRFRESCGLDAYDGYEVTPVRFKKSRLSDPVDLIPLVKHSNNLIDAGYWGSGHALRVAIGVRYPESLKFRLPSSSRADLPILTWRTLPWESDSVKYFYNRNTCLTFVKGWSFKPNRLEMLPESERMYFRESLSRGGPVGVFFPRRSTRRFLDARYSGVLIKRKHVVIREYSKKARGESQAPRSAHTPI